MSDAGHKDTPPVWFGKEVRPHPSLVDDSVAERLSKQSLRVRMEVARLPPEPPPPHPLVARVSEAEAQIRALHSAIRMLERAIRPWPELLAEAVLAQEGTLSWDDLMVPWGVPNTVENRKTAREVMRAAGYEYMPKRKHWRWTLVRVEPDPPGTG